MAKTLLLADDNPTIQRVVALTFANEDITVVPVADGELAVDAMIHSAPDIVLADIAMPGRGGYDLVDFMRHSPGLVHIPVLLLASAFEIVDTARAHAVGANGIISKPFDPAVVIGRVHELLNLGTPEAQAVAPANAPPAPLSVALPTAPPPSVTPPTLRSADAGPSHAPIEPEPASPVLAQPDSGDGYAEMDVDDELPLTSPTPSVAASDVDRYFESVDQAFTQLNLSRRPLPGLHVVEPFELPDLPLTTPLDHAPPSLVEEPAPASPAPLPVPSPSPMSLTDAFSALLEAESGAVSTPALAPVAASPAPIAAPAADMDALVEQVAKRVLEQLSDRVVREIVSDIVLTTAERLVREEIERITHNIP